MGILRADRVSGLGGANAINGSVKFSTNRLLEVHGAESNEDFRLSNGSFTIEFWANVTDLTNSSFVGLFENVPARRSWMFEIRSNQALRFEWWTDGSSGSNLTSSTGIVSLDTWHHYAVVRNGTALNIYVDGTSVANTTTSDTFYENTIEPLTIGGVYQAGALTQDINGYVSNLRIIKGEAIYTSAFTPPTQRLEKTANTVLLCCQSPGDVTQEATDKTIVPISSTTASSFPVASHFAPDVGEDHGTTFGDNTKFDTLSYMVPPGGTTAERGRGRGILFGGGSPGRTNRIDYIEIPNGGNSMDFGDLVCGSVWGSGAGASSTRGVFWGGENQYTKLDYVTIATTGNATSFGTSSTNSNGGTCMSSETRAVYVLGAAANTMEYVTIATTGNTTDFGDQGIDDNLSNAAGLASPTRGIVSGGYGPSPYPQSNTIEYITIATTGNGTDFGDLTFGHSAHTGVSNTTRGVFAKGYTFPSPATVYYNTIEYVTIASTGNATDFGDATNTVSQGYGSSTHIRGVFAGGNGGSDVNTIDYITIASTGNAKDFGDTYSATRSGSGTSDSHGGIS